ncbi:Ig-like domain-containing protein [Arsenicibacter rosenii]
MRVYTLDGTLIAVAWGEDASTAGNGLPYLDLGTTVTPDRRILVSKLATITVDNGQPGIVDPGDEVTYRIVVQNASLRSRNVVSITDTIPAGFSYVANSTRRNRTVVIPDQTNPNTAFPLDETGYNLGDLILAQRDTLSFRVIAQRPLVANATVTNRVTYSDNLNDQVSGQVTISINQAYPPVANREAVTTPFNTSVGVNVLTNDTDRAFRPAALTNVSAPTIFTQPKNGTATLTNGVLVYRPGSTFAGQDTVVYRLCDNLNTNLCDTALVAITVQSLPPTANRDNVTTPFNVNVQISTLTNDVDRAGRPASLTGASANVSSFSVITQPANGTIAIGANGLLTYNPNDTYAGTDQLIYRICDNVNTSLCDTALVFITIQSAPPVANRNDVTTAFNTNSTILILANDTDKAGRPAALTNVSAPVITQNPANGAVVVNADGSITYDPNDTFAGTDQLIYRICDNVNASLCDTALVTIRVNSAPPVANPETVNLAFNVTTTVSILANDVDKAGRPAALTNVSAPVIVVAPKHGSAVVNADGTLTYNPDDTFAGLDTLQYRICDTFSGTLCATTYVAFNVGSNAPTAGADVTTTPFNQNITVNILTNDTDRASQPASLSTVTLPQILYGPVNGTAIINANGTLTYNPNDTFAGVDTIRYRICDNVNTSLCSNNLVTITVQSAPPVANPESLTTGFNVTTTIAVLANDVDKAARPAALTNVTAPVVTQNPANGVVVVNADGTITYNPNDTFAGQDSFIYRLCDNVNNALCDTALVRILIQSAPPVANPDSYTTAFNTNLTMAVLGNDVDKANRPAALTNVSAPVIVVQPLNGTAIVNANGTITYNPEDTYAGTDQLTYRICDNITPSLCSTALVTMLIQSAPPVANRNDVTTAFNTDVTIPVLTNDVDKAGRPAALTNVSAPAIFSQPANGTVLVNADGSITYNPNDTFAGQDSFIYRICDLIDPSKCDTALVTVQIGSAPPVANPDSYTTAFNTNLTMAVLGNDVDKANRPAALTNVSAPTIFSQPANGTVLVNADGSITYNPNDTFAGQDSFVYRICDLIDPSKCDTALVTVQILSAPPVANRNDVTTAFNTNITIPVLTNDVDKAGRPAALTNVSAPTIFSQPANGTVLVNADGSITYNPNDTFAGQDSFIYRICDLIDPSKCDTALVTVQILSAPPVANRNDVTTAFNTNITIPVLTNDVDKAGRTCRPQPFSVSRPTERYW